MVLQAHYERDQLFIVRPEFVEGFLQSLLNCPAWPPNHFDEKTSAMTTDGPTCLKLDLVLFYGDFPNSINMLISTFPQEYRGEQTGARSPDCSNWLRLVGNQENLCLKDKGRDIDLKGNVTI